MICYPPAVKGQTPTLEYTQSDIGEAYFQNSFTTPQQMSSQETPPNTENPATPSTSPGTTTTENPASPTAAIQPETPPTSPQPTNGFHKATGSLKDELKQEYVGTLGEKITSGNPPATFREINSAPLQKGNTYINTAIAAYLLGWIPGDTVLGLVDIYFTDAKQVKDGVRPPVVTRERQLGDKIEERWLTVKEAYEYSKDKNVDCLEMPEIITNFPLPIEEYVNEYKIGSLPGNTDIGTWHIAFKDGTSKFKSLTPEQAAQYLDDPNVIGISHPDYSAYDFAQMANVDPKMAIGVTIYYKDGKQEVKLLTQAELKNYIDNPQIEFMESAYYGDIKKISDYQGDANFQYVLEVYEMIDSVKPDSRAVNPGDKADAEISGKIQNYREGKLSANEMIYATIEFKDSKKEKLKMPLTVEEASQLIESGDIVKLTSAAPGSLIPV
jgi:hypothetical protein